MSSSHVDDMLAELSGGGQLATRGEFELDARKAREKMSKFQLQNPLAYVLEFVQASYLLGAERIDVVADSDEFEITWRGQPIQARELESLYSAAFSRQTDPRLQALKHLAIGVNAASALELSRLVIEGVESEGRGWRWTQIGEVEQLDFVEHEGRQPGHVRVYLKERLRWGHLGEFFERLRREVAEVELIKRECRYSPQEIHLNGKLFEHGMTLPDSCVASCSFEAEHVTGVAGLIEGQQFYVLQVTQHGVLVGGETMVSGLVGGHVLVNADHLQKDLSRASLVKDEAWRALTHELIPDVLEGLAAQHLADKVGYSASSKRLAHPKQEKWVETWLGQCLVARCKDIEQGREWGKGSEALYQIARRYPMLVLAHEYKDFEMKCGESHPRSIEEVVHTLQRQPQPRVSYGAEIMPEVEMFYPVLFEPGRRMLEPHETWKLARGEQGMAAILATLQGWPVNDLTKTMAFQRKKQKNMAIWEARDPMMDFEAPAHSVVSFHVASEEVRYTWSWSGEDAVPPQLVYVREGRLFSTRLLLAHPLLMGVTLTIEAPFNPNAYFSDVLLDAKHFELVVRAIAQFPEFVKRRAEWLESTKRLWRFHEFIAEYLGLLCSGRLFEVLVKSLQGELVQSEHLRRSFHGESHEHWKLAARLVDLPVPGQRFELFEQFGVLSRAPFVHVLETGSGASALLSLSDLAESYEEHGQIGYVTPEFNSRRLEFLEPGRKIVVVGSEARERLEALVSRFVLSNVEAEINSELRLIRFRKKPLIEDISTRWGDALAQIEFQADERVTCKGALWPLPHISEAFASSNVSISGQVELSKSTKFRVGGTSFEGARPVGSISIRFVYEEREMVTHTITEGIGRFELQVDATHMAFDDEMNEMKRDVRYLSVLAQAKLKSWVCTRQVVDELTDRVETLDVPQWKTLWGLMDVGMHGPHNKTPEGSAFARQCKVLRAFRDHLEQRWINHDELVDYEDYRGRIFFVYRGEEVHYELLPGGKGHVVELPSPDLLELFGRVLGEGAELVHVAHSDEAMARMERARAKFMERSEVPWTEPAGHGKREFVWSRQLQIDARHGAMGMWLDEEPKDSVAGIQIELLHQGRRIQTATRQTYLGRFGVRIQADDLDVDPSWDRLTSSAELQALCTKITTEVERELITEIEAIYQHPQELTRGERLMWLGYLQVVEKSQPKRLDEAELKQLVTGLPLFQRRDGVWCNVEQVRESAMRQASKVYVVDSMELEVPERYLTSAFVLPHEQERADWRELFGRAIITDLQKMLESIDRIKNVKVSSTSFASASKDWAQKKREIEKKEERDTVNAVPEDFSSQAPSQDPPAPPLPAPRLAPPVEPEPIDPKKLFEERVLEELRHRLLSAHTNEHDLMAIQDDLIRHLAMGYVDTTQRIDVRQGRVMLDPRHVALQAIEEDPEDEVWWHVLVSAVYSAINTYYREVTDRHEELFLRALIV